MKHFRHKITGKIDRFPAHFVDLYSDIMEEVDPNEAACVDCGLQPVFLEPPVVESEEDEDENEEEEEQVNG